MIPIAIETRRDEVILKYNIQRIVRRDQCTPPISAGAKVSITVAEGCLVVEPKARPKYTMAELLAASDYSEPHSPEDREWVDTPAVGGEIL